MSMSDLNGEQHTRATRWAWWFFAAVALFYLLTAFFTFHNIILVLCFITFCRITILMIEEFKKRVSIKEIVNCNS